MPHNHQHRLGQYHKAGPKEVQAAIDAALKARKEWANMPWEQRAGIFMKAADLLAHQERLFAECSYDACGKQDSGAGRD